MKKILLSSVALIGIAGTAVAADLPARMPVKAPPIMAPAFSWTGCYIGGYVGGAWANRQDGDYDVVTRETPDAFVPSGYAFYHAGAVGGLHAWSYDLDSSIIGGGTVGCNWQPLGSQFVLGIEGEGGYMNLEGTAYDPLQALPLTYGSSAKIGDWYGMLTGRLGFAFDRAMIYVKGGVAFVNVETAIFDTAPIGALPWNATTSNTVATWTVGGGIEWAFDMNWSVKAEYMYIGLDETHDLRLQLPGAFAGDIHNWSQEYPGIHTAKIGLNYRFGGGAPVVARY